MAALRNGMKTVLIPAENVSDLEEIDQTVRAALKFVPVEQVDQVLSVVLETDGAQALPDLEALSEPVQGTVRSLDLKQ